jgi:hypothetical protein
MQVNKSLNRSGGWARNLNSKVAGRRPVSFGVSQRQLCVEQSDDPVGSKNSADR